MSLPSIERLCQAAKILTPSLAQDLLDGIDREDLELQLGILDVDRPPEISRMNLLGSLRSIGVVFEGKKGAQVVRITGIEDKKTDSTESWSRDQLDLYNEVTGLPRLDDSYESIRWLEDGLKHSRQYVELFENSILYFLSYEVTDTNQSHLYRVTFESGNKAILKVKFPNVPRIQFFGLTSTCEELVSLGRQLSTISFRPIVFHIPPPTIEHLKVIDPRGFRSSSDEIIYDCKTILDHYSSRDMKAVRRMSKDTQFLCVEGSDDLQLSIIEEWRRVNEPKQRQLAIRRDYTAVTRSSKGKLTFLALRHNALPVSLQIVDRLVGEKSVVAQLVEKSLNYRSQQGGQSGTSDWSLFRLCEECLNRGVTLINGGMIQGGEKGLEHHKRRLGSRIVKKTSWTLG